jgi:hypothetical protein
VLLGKPTGGVFPRPRRCSPGCLGAIDPPITDRYPRYRIVVLLVPVVDRAPAFCKPRCAYSWIARGFLIPRQDWIR